MKRPVFVKGAMNVYRTNNYIVKQNIYVNDAEKELAEVVSRDVYYFRTKSRDKLYETYFEKRKEIEGKRLPSNMYTRKYEA